MGKFVNREEELAQIDKAIEMLQGDQQPLRTPIIEFCGIDGIGKSTLLRQVEERCRTKQILCERKNVGEITVQHLAASAQELLAKKRPFFILLDAFDAVSANEAGKLEIELRNLIFSNERVCIVLACRSVQNFRKTRSIARKMKIHILKPLNRKSCFSYLDDFGEDTILSNRELIYEWTQGYPLAMDTMVEAMLKKQVDLHALKDQKKLIQILSSKIINQTLLATLQSDAARLSSFEKLLTILSFPRSFNLFILQSLVEKYVPQFKLKSSLAYIILPEEINQVTNVVNWDVARSGYCIDASARNIFLLKSRIEDPELYRAVNEYLMKMNEAFVTNVPEPDNIHYLREYLYHLAKTATITEKPDVLLDELEHLVKKDSTDQFLRFYEEFWQDEDLRKTLGANAKNVITFIRKRFIELFKNLPEGIGRFQYLLSFLSRTLPASTLAELSPVSRIENPFLILEPAIRQIMQEEKPEVYTKFSAAFSQDHMLEEALGEDFQRMLLLFSDSPLGEK